VNQSLAKENAILRNQYDAMKIQHDSVVHLLRGQRAIHSVKEHELRSRLEELKRRLKQEETERTLLLEQIRSRDEMPAGRYLLECKHCMQVEKDGCVSVQYCPRQYIGTSGEEVNGGLDVDAAEKKGFNGECSLATVGPDGDDFVAHEDEGDVDECKSHWSYGGMVSSSSHAGLEDSNKENSSPCSADRDEVGNQDDKVGQSIEVAGLEKEWVMNTVMKRLDGEIEDASHGPVSIGESCCAAGTGEESFPLPMVQLEYQQKVADSKASLSSSSLIQIEEIESGYVTPVRYGLGAEAVIEARRMSPAGSNKTETRRSSLRARGPIDYTLPSIRSKLRQVSVSYMLCRITSISDGQNINIRYHLSCRVTDTHLEGRTLRAPPKRRNKQ